MLRAKSQGGLRKLIVVHYANVNLYPPLQNLLAALLENGGTEVELVTGYSFKCSGVKVLSPKGIWSHSRSKILHYAWWFTVLLAKGIFRQQEVKMLLYESNAFPALVLPINRADLWLHFHEYRLPDRMKLSFFEWCSEMMIRKLIHKPEYVSLVTEARRHLLIKEGVHTRNEIRVMWNCPRQEWAKKLDVVEKHSNAVVMVGAVGKNTWSVEVMQAFESQDIYELHVYGKDEFDSTHRVKYCGWVNYDVLPEVLSKYQVGLVWYNEQSLNFTSGISNKIFEYLHCGLKVIASRDLVEASQQLADRYPASLWFVDFKTDAWMETLEDGFRANQMIKKEHHFKLCSGALLEWIYD